MNMTPRYLYEETGCVREVVIVPLAFVRSRLSTPDIASLYDLGKFTRAVFVSSKGELCVSDQLNPPPGHSIISLSLT